MTFNSYNFLFIFLPVTLLAYWLLRTTRYVNWFLCAASIVFYAFAGVVYVVPLLFTCIFDYVVGQQIAPGSPFRHKKALFVISLVVQLSLLATLKYAGWLSGAISSGAAALGFSLAIPALSLILPPGISFYTFHTISYTADIYRGKFKPHNRLIDYITFVAFFPQLVAGPIARASDLLPQVAAKRPAITWEQAEIAFWLICWGLFKKIALADNFGHIVGMIAEQLKPGATLPGMGLLFAYAFAGQIYCDFSAYTDIARGVAKLFNIELTRNFLTPYFATSPSDFWRRWHISLSTWLRDYLYIPLGGDKHGRWKTLRNLAITMFLGGLWHGAGIGYILWGMYHGMLLVVYRLGKIEEKILGRLGERWGKIIAALITFHMVCFGWILFRATPAQLGPALSSLGWFFAGKASWHSLGDMIYGLTIYSVPLAVTEYIAYTKDREFVDLYTGWRWEVRAALYVVIFYAVVMFGARQQNEFIYFQF